MNSDTAASGKVPFKSKKELAAELWNLSYPTMAAFALQSLYDLVDMAWVGKISAQALSGVTLFATVYSLFTILNEVAGSSSVSMISQSYGRGTKEYTQHISEQTISFKIVLAIISALLLAVFLKPILNFYTSDQIVIDYALNYGWIRIFFIPMMFSSYSVNTIFRCTGDAKTPMIIMLISALTNMVLDPVFMFEVIPYTNIRGLGLGVFGAALATVTATALSFIYGFVILISGKRNITISLKGLLRLDKKIDLGLLKIGMPCGTNLLIRQLSIAVIMKFVSMYGAYAIALSGIGAKISQFAFMPIFGFGMGGSAVVGHLLGKENVREAKSAAKLASLMSGLIVGFFALIVCLFPEPLMSAFLKDTESLASGISMIRLMSISLIPLAFAMGLTVAFSGSGDNNPKLYSSIAARWFVQIPFLYIAVKAMQLPLNAVWVSYIVSEIVELFIIIFFYKKGKWKTMRV